MVRVGLICEGKTELNLFLSSNFKQLLSSYNLSLIKVINAKGSGNLLPHNIEAYIKLMEKNGANKIIIQTDLDQDECKAKTIDRIKPRQQDVLVISVRKIEAWFLADTQIMQKFLKDNKFHFQFPEKKNPFDTINNFFLKSSGKRFENRVAGKIKLVTRLLDLGLDISRAASHPNCPRAKYFVNKLIQIGKQ